MIVRLGIDQTTASIRPEKDQYGRYSTVVFDARYRHAIQKARTIVGITMASMITVALIRISAFPSPTGPIGASTPEQAETLGLTAARTGHIFNADRPEINLSAIPIPPLPAKQCYEVKVPEQMTFIGLTSDHRHLGLRSVFCEVEGDVHPCSMNSRQVCRAKHDPQTSDPVHDNTSAR
jgi:hypothetical protein